MVDPIRAFPKRLREAREAAGTSTEELARRLHVSRRTVWLWERGLTLPMFRQLVAIKRVLGFDPLAP
jgi:transcriptional regulator with XRE-family HTH domain